MPEFHEQSLGESKLTPFELSNVSDLTTLVRGDRSFEHRFKHISYRHTLGIGELREATAATVVGQVEGAFIFSREDAVITTSHHKFEFSRVRRCGRWCLDGQEIGTSDHPLWWARYARIRILTPRGQLADIKTPTFYSSGKRVIGCIVFAQGQSVQFLLKPANGSALERRLLFSPEDASYLSQLDIRDRTLIVAVAMWATVLVDWQYFPG
jgi:hypothetical protein